MKITAQYAGTCRTCRKPYAVGDKVDWQRGRGAAHVECPPDSAPPAAAPAKPLVISRPGGRSKPNLKAWVGRVFQSKRDGILAVISADARHYREDGLSFGLDDDAGWLLLLTCRPATPEETEAFQERETSAALQAIAEYDARAAKAAQEKAIADAQEEVFRAAVEGLERTETWPQAFYQELTREPKDGGRIAFWSRGSQHSAEAVRFTTADGAPVVVLYDSHYDSDRAILCAPRAVIERAWELLQQQTNTTPEQSRAFLAQYKQAVGRDYHTWNAARGV